MKNFYRNLMIPICLLLAQVFGLNVKSQQTLTQVNGWNAYVHLPASYSTTSNSYPTIIFFPGLGEIGTSAAALISNGPGAYISQGWNGNVVINSNTVEFIVISLQPPSAYPSEVVMNQRIQTLKSLYRINNNKLYLTGLSHGGWCSTTFVTGDPYGGPYTFASQIAAVVEVEGVMPDDNSPYPNLFDNFANVGGRLLGFEQSQDNRGMPTRVNRMNATKPGSAIYVQTNFGGGGHCCWNQFYGGGGLQPGNFMLDGVSQNLYQWLAAQSLGNTNQLPTANAGANKVITLPVSATTLDGSGTDPDGSITAYLWTKISGPAAGTLSNATSAQASVAGLTAGVYQYQLKVTDNSGAASTALMQVTVNATATLLPSVNPANTVNGLDYKYYEGTWSVMPDYSTLSPVKTGATADFNLSLANRPTAYGFSFTGFINVPADGQYTFYTSSDDGSNLYIDNVLVVANDGLHGTIEKSGVIGLQAGKHAITGLFFQQSGGQVFVVSYEGMGITKQAIPASVLYEVNNMPVASAGTDQTITLPISTVALSGSGTDADGTITAYQWTQVSGGAGSSFSNASAALTNVNGLVQGTYQFQLKVTDNSGATATSVTQTTVNTATTTATKTVRVNVYGGANSYNDTKWNNWNISAGTTSSNFLYEDLTASTLSAVLSGDVLVVDNGANYASGATTTPPAVLRYNSGATSQRTLNLKGLNPAKKYSLEFYGSRGNTGNKTVFIIGNIKDTVNTDSNISDYAKFADIIPDNTGLVQVNISRVGVWNYLAGFSIIEQAATGARISNNQSVITSINESQLSKGNGTAVYPNPFQGSFTVQINDKAAGVYTLVLSDISGKRILQKTINKTAGVRVETIQVNKLPAGTYMLDIIAAGGSKTIQKLIKY